MEYYGSLTENKSIVNRDGLTLDLMSNDIDATPVNLDSVSSVWDMTTPLSSYFYTEQKEFYATATIEGSKCYGIAEVEETSNGTGWVIQTFTIMSSDDSYANTLHGSRIFKRVGKLAQTYASNFATNYSNIGWSAWYKDDYASKGTQSIATAQVLSRTGTNNEKCTLRYINYGGYALCFLYIDVSCDGAKTLTRGWNTNIVTKFGSWNDTNATTLIKNARISSSGIASAYNASAGNSSSTGHLINSPINFLSDGTIDTWGIQYSGGTASATLSSGTTIRWRINFISKFSR